ncbi:hypothetical protein ABZ614_07985 [Streptomyces sp. NPDC013178]
MDPKLVAATFGMDARAALIYLADHVDQEAELASRTTAKSTRPPR